MDLKGDDREFSGVSSTDLCTNVDKYNDICGLYSSIAQQDLKVSYF